MLSVITDAQGHDELRVVLDAIVCEGARPMLAAAVEAEVDAYLAAHPAERDEGGRRLVVPARPRAPAPGRDRRGGGHGPRAAGQRSPGRPGHGRAGPGPLGDLAAVVPQAPP